MSIYISPTGNSEVWQEKPDGYYTLEEWQELHPITEEPDAITLNEYKEIACQTIRNKSSELKKVLQSGYSDGEIATFQQQFDGATDIINDQTSTVNAQFVIDLLTVRLGVIPTTEQINSFADLIITNFNNAKEATIAIVGRQQNAELAVRACEDKEAIDVVVNNYLLFYAN